MAHYDIMEVLSLRIVTSTTSSIRKRAEKKFFNLMKRGINL